MVERPLVVEVSAVLYAVMIGLVLARAARGGARRMWIVGGWIAFVGLLASVTGGVPLYTYWCAALCGYGWFIEWPAFALSIVLAAAALQLTARLHVPLWVRALASAACALPLLWTQQGFWIS